MIDQPHRDRPADEAATARTDVAGRCPACRGGSLFLGSGGHVTCARLDCPNPSAADNLLHGQPQAAIQAAADREERAVSDTHIEECRIVHSSRASGMREALRILRSSPAAHDGPTITEAAADDRRWWNGGKGGE